MKDLDLLPDINKYLESIDYNIDCKLDSAELLIEDIAAKEHLDKDVVKILITLIFNEIRNSMLNGISVKLFKFGTFKSLVTKNKVVLLKFKQVRGLFKVVNEDK
jgi:hypothetical protein